MNKTATQAIQQGVQHHQAGRLQEARSCYQTALSQVPNQPDANHLLGVIAFQTGQYKTAVELIQKAITANPTFAEAYNHLAQVYRVLDQPDKAADCLTQVVSLQPNHPDAFYHLGIFHHKQGRLSQAIDCYQTHVSNTPNHAGAHNNLGIAFQAQNQLDKAITHYQNALTLKPDFAEAYNNLGTACEAQAHPDEARVFFQRALTLKPDYSEAAKNLAKHLRGRGFSSNEKTDKPTLRFLLTTCFNQEDINAQDLFHATWDLLLTPNVLANLETESPLASPVLLDLFHDALFLTLLKKTLVVDLKLESLLTRTRREIALSRACGDSHVTTLESLVVALAHQCFFNEYVFAQTPEETQALSKLNNDPFDRVLSACYAPLRTADLPLEALPDPDLVRIQIDEPNQERTIARTIECLTPVQDPVSHQVMQQYEENPYPRWQGLYHPQPITTRAYIQGDISPNNVPLPEMPSPDVLVAGCGTGSQPISCAQAYKDSNVLAIDLSLPSLCYAKRKAMELNVTNLSFMQGDILDLNGLDRTFDVIECAGVLHHMADPIQGWRSLLNHLKPQGIMKIGLYSEHARQFVKEARAFIASEGYTPTPEDIRQCRQAITALPDNHPIKPACHRWDFFTMSTVRDLLFHVKEHRFTWPRLRDILEELNLELLGLILDRRTKQHYLSQFPQDATATNLLCWDQYERRYPNTFTGMYKFWVRKRQHHDSPVSVPAITE